MLLTCPHCGPRDSAEFVYYGDATRVRPELGDDSPEHWHVYVHERDNPNGPHKEFWQHAQGCRQWLVVERNTSTHEIGAITPARRGGVRS
jgi:methylglutamate dehydrogenase subunit B